MLKNGFPLILSFTGNGHMHVSQMRWCVISEKEHTKCLEFNETAVATSASKMNWEVQFSCVIGSSLDDCMDKIKSGSADLITLDGGHIKTAGNSSLRVHKAQLHRRVEETAQPSPNPPNL